MAADTPVPEGTSSPQWNLLPSHLCLQGFGEEEMKETRQESSASHRLSILTHLPWARAEVP